MKRLSIICLLLCAVFSVRAAEILYGPYVQAVTEDAAYVVWVTDKATYGWVELKGEGEKKPATFVESHIGLKHYRRVHRVPVTGLKPGTKYTYEVFSQEDNNGKLSKPISKAVNAHGNPYSFRTNDRNKESISWLMVTDIHYNKH